MEGSDTPPHAQPSPLTNKKRGHNLGAICGSALLGALRSSTGGPRGGAKSGGKGARKSAPKLALEALIWTKSEPFAQSFMRKPMLRVPGSVKLRDGCFQTLRAHSTQIRPHLRPEPRCLHRFESNPSIRTSGRSCAPPNGLRGCPPMGSPVTTLPASHQQRHALHLRMSHAAQHPP